MSLYRKEKKEDPPPPPPKLLFTIAIQAERSITFSCGDGVRSPRVQTRTERYGIPIVILAESQEEAEAYLEARLQELLGRLR